MKNREPRARKSDVKQVKGDLDHFINREIGKKCRNWRRYVVLVENSAKSILIEFRGLATHLYNHLQRRLPVFAKSNSISYCSDSKVMRLA